MKSPYYPILNFAFYILHLIFFGFAVPTSAQDYHTAFNQGDSLYQLEQYYEAYLRFNAAEVLSNNAGSRQFAARSREWLEKAAYGIQRQQEVTDSLLRATKKLTDAFYFWDGRLALAYKNGRYGFINKKGEVIVDYQYDHATNFNDDIGYAQVKKNQQTYWLAPDGQEYADTIEVKDLPRIQIKTQISEYNQSLFNKLLVPEQYEILRNQNHHKVLREGIQLFNEGLYYDAFRRFQAAVILGKNANDKKTAEIGSQLKDTAVAEILQLTSRAEEALRIAKNIREAIYFYENKYALAFKNGRFYFIDENGRSFTALGTWDKAKQFDSHGLAKVTDNKINYLLDTFGLRYRVAYHLEELNENTTALDLRGSYLSQFPSEVYQHQQLQLLLLDGLSDKKNSNRGISKEIQNLNQLKIFSLSNYNLSVFPQEITHLASLRDLYLNGSNLKELPSEIAQLQQLNSLHLSDNQLSHLPKEIGKISKLEKLDLSNNNFKTIPREVCNLSDLKSLSFKNNHLKKLPTQFSRLKGLTSLDFSNNYFFALPTEIFHLNNLKLLYLHHNQLNSLPPELKSLGNLTELYLSSNQLHTLPKEIGQLKYLISLDLNSNRLKYLPEEIGELKRLIYLSLNDNQLSSLPKTIGQLQNLTHLSISANQIQILPLETTYLKTLTSLNLSSNLFKVLPPEIGNLKNLTSLYLWDNPLNELPPEIKKLTNLKVLSLNENLLLKLPSETSFFKNLTSISLGKNHLKSLPDQIWGMEKLNIKMWEEWRKSFSNQKNFKLAYRCTKKLVELDPNNYRYWFNLSFYALFVNQPEETISAVQKTLQLNPNAHGIETNLALGYLLNNQWSLAEKIYRKWKGQAYESYTVHWDEIFLLDIQELEAAGIAHPDFEKVKQLFQK